MSASIAKANSNPAALAAKLGIPRWKRVLDVAMILMAMPVVLPLSLVIAMAIKVLSPGPVFFRQERVGYLGRRFQILKFRTMVLNADPHLHQTYLKQLIRSDRPMVKLDVKNDPRLIPFGTWLRSLGLDEIPQLFNVLRGEMSLFGPRPSIPYEFEQYEAPHFQRLQTLPGLTGLWQVSGKNRTTFGEMMELDLRYVRDKSVFLDLKIILKTIPAIALQVYQTRRSPAALPVPYAGNATEDHGGSATR